MIGNTLLNTSGYEVNTGWGFEYFLNYKEVVFFDLFSQNMNGIKSSLNNFSTLIWIRDYLPLNTEIYLEYEIYSNVGFIPFRVMSRTYFSSPYKAYNGFTFTKFDYNRWVNNASAIKNNNSPVWILYGDDGFVVQKGLGELIHKNTLKFYCYDFSFGCLVTEILSEAYAYIPPHKVIFKAYWN